MTSSGRATLTPDYIRWKNMSVTAPAPFYIENTRQLDGVKFLGMCEQNLRVRNQLVYDGYEVQFDLNNTSGTGLMYIYVSSGRLSFKGAVVKGHKYYKECVVDFDENYDTFEKFYWSTLQQTQWTIYANSSSISTAPTTASENQWSLRVMGLPVGKHIAGTMTFQIIDLTLLYGAGNEPETVQDFKDSYEEMFGHPLTYEPYDPGTVLEPKDIICNNGALKVSPNLFNINGTNTSNGYVNQKYLTSTGSLASFGAARVSEYIIVTPETDYYYSGIPNSHVGGCSICWYDSNKSFLSGVTATKGVKTSPQSAAYCRLSYRTDAGSPYMFTKGNDPVTYMAYRQVYTDGTQETLNVRHKGITPSSFSGYQATSERTGMYSYSFSWTTSGGQSWNGVYASNIAIIEEHKYYYCANMSSSTPANLTVSFSSGLTSVTKGKTNVVANTDYLLSEISEATTSSNSIIMYIRAGYADTGVDYTGYAKNIGLFDLTEIFGAGNEPTTVNDARQLLGLDNCLTATDLLGCGSYKDMQDILTGDISRNVGIKILNGTERFALDNWRPYNGTYAFALYKNELPGILEASTDNVICTHFKSASYSGGGGVYYGGTGINIYSNNGDYSIFIRVPNSIATSMATMKDWLAQQYANGTPVIVAYPLNSTETDSPVTGQELSIQKGTNTFEIIQSSVDNLSLHVDYKAVENTQDYLSFTATANSSSVTLNKTGSPNAVNLEYSPNTSAWIPYRFGDTISLSNGDKVYFRNADSTVKTQLNTGNASNYYRFVMSGSIEAGGNIMSLLDRSCNSKTVGNGCFYSLFRDCTSLKEPPKLPATTVGSSAYYDMFYGCTYLLHSPELPAITLGSYCYYDMFINCTRMVDAPVLPATTLANGCYYCMFQNCQAITSHHVANLNNNCQKMFNNNYACTQLTIDAVIPPTINSNTFSGMKSDCIIYVPAESVDAYKAKQYWSDRAAYIQAMS